MNNNPLNHPINIESLLDTLTLEEKASLCSGMDSWNTKSIERLDLPSIFVSDGPHGVRKVLTRIDYLKSETSLSTCFPTASAMGASWDRDLIYEIGAALGKECISLEVDVLLAPGINMKRTPLCGRNFEYFSEDPYHTAMCAISYIRGVQDQGVGTSLKHYACNNQEFKRFSIDAVIDERTLREIYLRAFEMIIHAVEPWTVMNSYNSVNNCLVSENRRLLTEILRDEWGYSGLVVSDWSSIYNRVKALQAGCDLQMPGKEMTGDEQIIAAVQSGELDEEVVNTSVKRYLSLVQKAHIARKNKSGYDREAHHHLARKAAGESMVLLKNEGNILPLKKETIRKIAVIGEYAKHPRIQGKGSSLVNASTIDIPLDEITKRAGEEIEIVFAPGYIEERCDYVGLITEAKSVAQDADVVLVFVGTGEYEEAEGIDRKDISLPVSHNLLVSGLSEVNTNVIVLLGNGSAVTMPWHAQVKGILETWLCGQGSAHALADILFGIINPSGKLSESFPLRFEDTPTFIEYPGDNEKSFYAENLYIGYRYYDKRNMDLLFPFGFGLSYTTFSYSQLSVTPATCDDTREVTVKISVKNTGSRAGKEIVQLYVRDVESSISKPEKELKGFEKISLEPGEEKEVVFTLDRNAFTHYDVKQKKWSVESGSFEILVGSSSREIRSRYRIEIYSEDTITHPFTRHTYLTEFYDNPLAKMLLQEWLNQKTNNQVQLDDFKGLKRDGIKNSPLSKFTVFLPEICTDEELDQIADKINKELDLI